MPIKIVSYVFIGVHSIAILLSVRQWKLLCDICKTVILLFFSVPFILYDKLNELIVIWFEYNWCVSPSVCLAIGICVLRSLSFPFPLIELIVFLGPVKTSQTNSTICNMDVSIYFVAVLFVYACLLFSQKLIERVFYVIDVRLFDWRSPFSFHFKNSIRKWFKWRMLFVAVVCRWMHDQMIRRKTNQNKTRQWTFNEPRDLN